MDLLNMLILIIIIKSPIGGRKWNALPGSYLWDTSYIQTFTEDLLNAIEKLQPSKTCFCVVQVILKVFGTALTSQTNQEHICNVFVRPKLSDVSQFENVHQIYLPPISDVQSEKKIELILQHFWWSFLTSESRKKFL